MSDAKTNERNNLSQKEKEIAKEIKELKKKHREKESKEINALCKKNTTTSSKALKLPKGKLDENDINRLHS